MAGQGSSKKKQKVPQGKTRSPVREEREGFLAVFQRVEEGRTRRWLGFWYLIAGLLSLLALAISLQDPNGPGALGLNDLSYFLVLVLHGLLGVWYMVRPQQRFTRGRTGLDTLFGITLIAFLFSYFFALTANLDYIQRWQMGSEAINLSIDSSTEQRITFFRFLPFFAAYALSIFWLRPKQWWVFPSLMLASLLNALAFPNIFSTSGASFLILVAFVPLMLSLDSARDLRSFWIRGFFWGLLTTMLRNYWLGTYSLVTLQGVALVFIYRYGLFFLLLYPVYRYLASRPGGWAQLKWLLLAVSLSVFEFWAGHSWVGYPWTLAAHAVYQWVPLIQFAALTGVWGVSFLLYIFNAGLARSIATRNWIPAAAVAGVLVLVSIIGAISVPSQDPRAGLVAAYSEQDIAGRRIPSYERSGKDQDSSAIRVALVQQNEDPRKADYEAVLSTLIRVTDLAKTHHPELVVWSETAFPPNLRHWSTEEPTNAWERLMVRLVGQLLNYQKSLGRWLLTGNDDYTELKDEEGLLLERTNYNAAILFDPEGRRVDTYHKMVLVPLTETFPYQSFFPSWFTSAFPVVEDAFEDLLELLKTLDVNLWGEGHEHLVFEIPGLPFSVPICFEDAFAYHIRDFVRSGARAIVNISNDYWALDEVQAEQHMAAGLFRAVENRVPMLRSTASGVTGSIDAYGRIQGRIPNYQRGFVVADVIPAPEDMTPTLYTRWGDWFPWLLAWLLILAATLSLGTHLVHKLRLLQSRRGEAGLDEGKTPQDGPAPDSSGQDEE